MKYSNLHNHSTFSDGINTPEQLVQEAIGQGMASLGFSDHSHTPHEDSYCMKADRYPAYLAELRRLKEVYGDRIRLFTGMELDYWSQIPERKDFDYFIASVHYLIIGGKSYGIDHSVPDQQGCIAALGGDVLRMAKAYFDLLTEHVDRCKPTLVGHFDVISKFGLMPEEDPRYRALAVAALERIIPLCPYIEMNTGAIAKGYRSVPYPAPYLLDDLKRLGGRIVLNADSHRAEHLTFWFDEAVQLLKEHGFDCIWQFNGKDFDRVEI